MTITVALKINLLNLIQLGYFMKMVAYEVYWKLFLVAIFFS